MSLSCSCDFDPEPGMKIWYEPNNYSTLEASKRKRCCSCEELISIGDTVAKFTRYKIPESEVEVNIWGEDGEIPLADHYMCESCADLYYSISELRFCVQLGNDMRDVLEQYKNGDY